MAGIRGFTPSDDVQDDFTEWWNTPIKNRYNILPLAEDANTGKNVWALPGLLAEPFESLKRVIASGGRTDTTYDDAGVPISGKGALHPLDGLNAVWLMPFGTMALGTAAGAIERGALGAGPTKAIGPRPEPGAIIPDTVAPVASRVLAETPYGIKKTALEQAAEDAFARQIEDGKYRYFGDIEYDDLGNAIMPEEYATASPWGRGAFNYVEPTSEAIAAAARAAGHDLDLTNFYSGSRYGTMKTKGGGEYSVRVADHGNTSRLHDAPDYNIAPGVMNPENFIDELMKLYSNPETAAAPLAISGQDDEPEALPRFLPRGRF